MPIVLLPFDVGEVLDCVAEAASRLGAMRARVDDPATPPGQLCANVAAAANIGADPVC